MMDSTPNLTNFNMTTMKSLVDLDALCNDPVQGNSSACDKGALGISLSTPILMTTTGVLGNVLALVVLYTSKKDVQKTVFFIFLAGLAWTDLVGQLLVSPIAIITYANNLKWVGGQELCTYHGFMMVCFGLLTPLIVSTMSIERLLALRFSYFYARVVTKRKAVYIIIACWMFTLFFCTWPLMGFGSYAHQFPGSWCFLNFHQESATDSGYAYTFAILNIVALLTILVCNIIVVVTLLQMRRNRKIKNSPSIDRKHHVKPKSLLQLEMETQMVWFLCAITLVFNVCWFPLNVNILINQVHDEKNYVRDLISVRLASINQILDPWLYILLRQRFFFKCLRRIKQFVANKRASSSSSSKMANHWSSQAKVSLSHQHSNCYQLKSICDKLDNSVSSEGTTPPSTAHLVPVQGNVKKHAPIRSQEKITHADFCLNGSSDDSDSDAFQGVSSSPPGRRRSFFSYDERMTRRGHHQNCQSSRTECKPLKSRLYSLPVYLCDLPKGQV